MASKICDGVYTFKITLPENPLRSLNCYVILGEKGGRNLIIDTGFRRPECQRALEKGMEELDIDPAVTDVFITHSHSDHCQRRFDFVVFRQLKNAGKQRGGNV